MASTRLRELASGIDALYFSGRCDIPSKFLEMLEGAKALALLAGDSVPILMGGMEFEVEARGSKMYRYVLTHPHGRVEVTPSKSLPAVRVQPRSTFLHGVGSEFAVDWFAGVLEQEFFSVSLTASRLDLHADWQGWYPIGDERSHFLCRSDRRRLFEKGTTLETLQFGIRKSGTVLCRIYDKTAEMREKGGAYWEDVWGEGRDPEIPVVRVEFEFGRQALRDFRIGSPYEAIVCAGGLWAYATSKWLTLRVPGSDGTPSRWAVAPEWEAIQRSTLAENSIGLDRIEQGLRRGMFERLVPILVGYLARYADLFGYNSAQEACGQLAVVVDDFCRSRDCTFEEKVLEKRRDRLRW